MRLVRDQKHRHGFHPCRHSAECGAGIHPIAILPGQGRGTKCMQGRGPVHAALGIHAPIALAHWPQRKDLGRECRSAGAGRGAVKKAWGNGVMVLPMWPPRMRMFMRGRGGQTFLILIFLAASGPVNGMAMKCVLLQLSSKRVFIWCMWLIVAPAFGTRESGLGDARSHWPWRGRWIGCVPIATRRRWGSLPCLGPRLRHPRGLALMGRAMARCPSKIKLKQHPHNKYGHLYR